MYICFMDAATAAAALRLIAWRNDYHEGGTPSNARRMQPLSPYTFRSFSFFIFLWGFFFFNFHMVNFSAKPTALS